MFFFKKLTVPTTNERMEINSVQLWEVRWHSRYGKYAGELREEVEAFTSENDANNFAKTLQNAYKLLRHTYGDEVIVIKSKSF